MQFNLSLVYTVTFLGTANRLFGVESVSFQKVVKEMASRISMCNKTEMKSSKVQREDGRFSVYGEHRNIKGLDCLSQVLTSLIYENLLSNDFRVVAC